MKKIITLIACTFMLGLIACQVKSEDKTKFSKAYTGEPIAAIQKFIADQKIDKTKANWKTKLPKPPKVQFDAKKTYFWTLHTDKGKIVIQLMPQIAPMHASSTTYLTLLGFYDDLTFHRIIGGFMAQGGDPLGNGRGSPGYRYGSEFSKDALHDRAGLLSMANAGPQTDGSQFFLTFRAIPSLNGKHTVFGEIKEGMKVLRALEQLGSPSGSMSKNPIIKKATISSK